MTETITENRHIFMRCVKDYHEQCPGVKYRDTYINDDLLGKIRSGKEKVYCECPCHAQGNMNISNRQ